MTNQTRAYVFARTHRGHRPYRRERVVPPIFVPLSSYQILRRSRWHGKFAPLGRTETAKNKSFAGKLSPVISPKQAWSHSKPILINPLAQYGLVYAMVRQDPDGAVVLANSLPGKYRERARYELTIGLIRSHRSEMEKILQGMQLDPETEERVRVYVDTNM